MLAGNLKGWLPKDAVCADTEILQDEPDPEFLVLVMQAEGTGTQCTDEIAREHACGLMGSVQRLLLVRQLGR
jgi:hypothetical protein